MQHQEPIRRRLLFSFLPALGITTLCCLWIVGPLASLTHRAVYHWSGPASTLFIPAVVDFLCVWLFYTLLLLTAQTAEKFCVALWTGIIFFLPWATYKSLLLLNSWMPPHWVNHGILGLSLAALTFALLRWKKYEEFVFRRLKNIVTTALCFVGLWGAVLLLQVVWFGWGARHLNTELESHVTNRSVEQMGAKHPRIIWIVLDELDYKQVYGQRLNGLQLPAFDELAKEASIFTNIEPAATYTQIVLPSLITGKHLDEIKTSVAGNLVAVHNSQSHSWEPFDQHATVFQDALNLGYKTALVGWYNPYCRIFSEVLDHCFWDLSDLSATRMVPHQSIVQNALNPVLLMPALRDHLLSHLASFDKSSAVIAKLHVSDYEDLFDQADRDLHDSSLDFVFLHMPIPHPVGIYNRRSRTLTTSNSDYLDNLALADSFLDHVRSLLIAQGQWDSSAIVVMGDHCWRTKLLWARSDGWTEEEERASDGPSDDRPGYIVKLPKQRTGSKIDHPFSAADTRALLDEIMNGDLTSPEAVSSWVARTLKAGGC